MHASVGMILSLASHRGWWEVSCACSTPASESRDVAQRDLARLDLDELDWAPEHRSESLSTVFTHAVGSATVAESWYGRKRGSKRRWGRMLRVGAILLGAAAALLPILAQISTTDDKSAIAPGWAAVCLTAAAALVALDHYFGFSAAWMRFMAAELRITRLRHDFEYTWHATRAASNTSASDDQVARSLALARDFVLAVDDVIADETGAWITEFRTSLERAEKSLARPDRP